MASLAIKDYDNRHGHVRNIARDTVGDKPSTSCFAAKMAPPDSYDPSASVDMPHPKWHKDAVAKYLDSCPNICSSPAPGNPDKNGRWFWIGKWNSYISLKFSYISVVMVFCLPGTNIHTTYTLVCHGSMIGHSQTLTFRREIIHFAVFFRAIRHL